MHWDWGRAPETQQGCQSKIVSKSDDVWKHPHDLQVLA